MIQPINQNLCTNKYITFKNKPNFSPKKTEFQNYNEIRDKASKDIINSCKFTFSILAGLLIYMGTVIGIRSCNEKSSIQAKSSNIEVVDSIAYDSVKPV